MSPASPSPEKNDTGNVISDYLEGYQQLELQAAENQVKKARNTLFVVAGLTLVVNLFLLMSSHTLDTASLIVILVLTAIFTALGFMTKKQPFTAIMIGLVIYAGLWIFDIVVLGADEVIKGLLFKIIIIYFLVTGLKHARETERLKKEIKRQG
ncbi:MAG: hypothetical protein WDO16_04405 [Bacteroidota bacterium]